MVEFPPDKLYLCRGEDTDLVLRPGQRTLWRVEKFLPLSCPNCRHKFGEDGRDYALCYGDVVEGTKVPRITNGHDTVFCLHCGNHTARVWLQAQTLATREEAQRLVDEEGFTNLQQMIGSSSSGPTTVVFNKKINGGPRIFHLGINPAFWPDDDFENRAE